MRKIRTRPLATLCKPSPQPPILWNRPEVPPLPTESAEVAPSASPSCTLGVLKELPQHVDGRRMVFSAYSNCLKQRIAQYGLLQTDYCTAQKARLLQFRLYSPYGHPPFKQQGPQPPIPPTEGGMNSFRENGVCDAE